MIISKIRNFAIIAHIDHGKSTLADRILELTNTVEKRVLKSQHLDSMSLEQERGITIKLNAVQIKYKDYLFHLIDTPGHVDFTYEVSRSLSACEGAILVVDAIQGVEAQTLANVYLAIDNNLAIIPVINKIDLPNADVDYVSKQIIDLLNIKKEEIILISAKTGQNVDLLLEQIVNKIPSPKGEVDKPLKALIFDSYFDTYRGVVIFFRVVEGQIKVNDNIKFFSSNKSFNVLELGVKTPNEIKKTKLIAGEVGWLCASIRDAKDINIGDTITLVSDPAISPLPGYKKLKPVVFTGFYPIDNNDFKSLKDALNKISLSDSSIYYEQEKSNALGYGFRIGCLGLLHMEILQQRLEREFDLGLIATFPSVEYEIYLKDNTSLIISNPSTLPHPTKIDYMKEPFIKANITVPNNFVGKVMELCQNKRGIFQEIDILDQKRQRIYYLLPLSEIIFDFFDYLKSYTKGYATFDYVLIDSREANLVKVEILLNGEPIDAFAFIAHKANAYKRAKVLCEKLKNIIPRHNFEIPIQAAINGKIIARETIKAYRKDVTAKLYGGDRTRRDKLLKKQKIGKKRSRQFGKVEIPQEAFLKVLKIDDSN